MLPVSPISSTRFWVIVTKYILNYSETLIWFVSIVPFLFRNTSSNCLLLFLSISLILSLMFFIVQNFLRNIFCSNSLYFVCHLFCHPCFVLFFFIFICFCYKVLNGVCISMAFRSFEKCCTYLCPAYQKSPWYLNFLMQLEGLL